MTSFVRFDVRELTNDQLKKEESSETRFDPMPSKHVLVEILNVSIIVISCAGIVSSSVVTLQSIQIFKSHEWLTREPTIYFRCQGENKTILPDVKKTYFLYTFKGAESWQVCSFHKLHFVHILKLTLPFFFLGVQFHAFNYSFCYMVH